MELKFIGNENAFGKNNNSAFFVIDNNLYMIDCSMLNMNKIKLLFDFNKYDSVNIIVTHTHADHVCGIPNIVDYLKYYCNVRLNIIVPLPLKEDIITLNKVCGVNIEDYNILISNDIPFIKDTIKTKHSEELVNGSFGYIFEINNKLILYTGDSANLDAFNKYLSVVDEAYLETSYIKTKAHTHIEDIKKIASKCKKIYLMHLDDEDKIRNEIKDLDNVFISELYKG